MSNELYVKKNGEFVLFIEVRDQQIADLEAENKKLKKRLLTAIEFVHNLAAGFPMGFWERTRRAGEVLKKINP